MVPGDHRTCVVDGGGWPVATQSSTLYANNISKLLLSMGGQGRFHVNLQDEVIRGCIITQDGELLWPPPVVRPPSPAAVKPQVPEPSPFSIRSLTSAGRR